MTTPEGQLEASIWLAMSDHKVTCPEPLKFIEAMTFAAQRYAAGDSPIVTALRRSVLHRDASPEGQISPSSAGESAERRPSFHPPGSGALPQDVADGGATRSTAASIPGDLTSRYGRISTDVDNVMHRGVDR